MANNKTLSERIVDSAGTGKSDPAELSALVDSVVAGDTIAAGTQVATITDASVAHALNATFSDVEVETALNALGTKINLILAALEEFNIAASA